jgi:hypothetical protein
MFFEAFNRRTERGEIALATSDDGQRWTYRQIVLAEPFHLSYPYVFEWEDEHFLVPESRRAGEVRLYRAEPFPTRWELLAVILERSPFADPSLFRHDDRWWLFAETAPVVGDASDRYAGTLRLFQAADLTGPWLEHACSPIVDGDPSRSRPAGRVLTLGETIVRFSQDCARIYGESVSAFEITELTPTTYQEREVPGGPILRAAGQGWNADGMHHVDAWQLDDGGWLAAVDGCGVPPR